MNMKYVLSRFIHRLNENKVLIQRHTVHSFDFPIISRVRASIQRRLLFLFLMLLMRLLIEGGLYPRAASIQGNTVFIFLNKMRKKSITVTSKHWWRIEVYYGVLWCIIAYCCAMWCIVVYCGVLWRIVVYCGVLWCIVVYCGVLWRIVVYYVLSTVLFY